MNTWIREIECPLAKSTVYIHNVVLTSVSSVNWLGMSHLIVMHMHNQLHHQQGDFSVDGWLRLECCDSMEYILVYVIIMCTDSLDTLHIVANLKQQPV